MSVPIYVTEEVFLQLQQRADLEGTSVNFLVMHILEDTLGPPEPRPRRAADAGAHPVR